MDEEEEAQAEESKKRETETAEDNISVIKIGSNTSRPASVINKLSKIYCEDLKRAQLNNSHTIGIVDYLRYLVSSHVMTAICYFTEYTTFPDGIDKNEWKKSLRKTYRDSILSIIKELAVLHQKKDLKKYDKEQSDMTSRQDDLLNKTLYHILLSITLIFNSLDRQEAVIKDRAILYCLNIFDKCGRPNDGLKDYLEKHSIANRGAFYPPHVIRIQDEIMGAIKSGKYIKTGKLGICKIDNTQEDKYRVKTIYNDTSFSYVSKNDVTFLS